MKNADLYISYSKCLKTGRPSSELVRNLDTREFGFWITQARPRLHYLVMLAIVNDLMCPKTGRPYNMSEIQII